MLRQLQAEVESALGAVSQEVRDRVSSIFDKLFTAQRITSSSSKLMKFMIADILDFARMKENKLVTTLEEFDIRQIVGEMVSIQQFQAEKLGVTIEKHYINFDAVGFKVFTDPHRL